MSLTITYTNSHASHTRPGSILTGTVHFRPTKDEAIGKVTITLSGRCKVKIREHLHYTTRTFRSRGYYFHVAQEVFDGGGFTHKAGEYAWGFEFEVPETARPQGEVGAPAPRGVKGRRVLDHNGIMQVVSPAEGGESGGSRYDDFPPKSPWRGSRDLRPHFLPESFKVGEEKNRVVWEGRVEYALIAKAERPAGGGSKMFSLGKGGDWEVAVDVPLRSTLGAASKALLTGRQTMQFEKWIGRHDKKGKAIGRALSKLARRNTDIEETMQSGRKLVLIVTTAKAVQSQSTLPFIVKAMITLPTTSIPSSGLVSAPDNAPSQFPPQSEQRTSPAHAGLTTTVSITDLTVSLQRKTRVRDDSMAATEHTAVKLDKEVLCWRRTQRGIDIVVAPIPVTDKMEGGSMAMEGDADLEDLIHTPALTPTFSTYNIAVEYSLEFEITLRLFNTTVTLNSADSEAGIPGIVVLPASSSTAEEGEEEDASSTSVEDTGKKELPAQHAGKILSKEAEVAQERTEEEEDLPAYQQ